MVTQESLIEPPRAAEVRSRRFAFLWSVWVSYGLKAGALQTVGQDSLLNNETVHRTVSPDFMRVFTL